MSSGRQGQGSVGSKDSQPPQTRDEVSGLNDIRALARTTLERQAVKHPDEGSGETQALLESSSPAALGQVLLPAPGHEVQAQVIPVEPAMGEAPATVSSGATSVAKKTWLWVGVAVLGLALFLALRGGDPAEKRREAPEPGKAVVLATPEPAAPEPAPVAPAEPASKGATKPARPLAAAAETTKAAPTAGALQVKTPIDPSLAPDRAAPSPKDSPAKPAATAPTSPKSDDLDSLLNGATGDSGRNDRNEKKKESEANAAAKEEAPSLEILPAALTRDDVKQGMGTIRARVQVCYDRYKVPGNVTIKLRIESDGTVSSSTATDAKFSATETGQCVADAVKMARFRKVSGPPMTLSYPFKLE